MTALSRTKLVTVTLLVLFIGIQSAVPARADTVADLHAQLTALQISAAELQVPCDEATSKSNSDEETSVKVRQGLVSDISKLNLTGIKSGLGQLLTLTNQLVSDESTSLNLCSKISLNRIEMNEIQDKLTRISALPASKSESMVSALANGALISTDYWDTDLNTAADCYVQILQESGNWITIPATIFIIDTGRKADQPFKRFAIASLSPGTKYRWVLPHAVGGQGWVTPSPEIVPDYKATFVSQKLQLSQNIESEIQNTSTVWQSALYRNITQVVDAYAPLLDAQIAGIKAQAEKYPNQDAAYQELQAQAPSKPQFSADLVSNVASAIDFATSVVAFQNTTSKKLQDLIPKPKSITCIKGKVNKKVSGINPTCPQGFKKR